jgi:hypothetical protein
MNLPQRGSRGSGSLPREADYAAQYGSVKRIGYNSGYTLSMTTAVSVLDDLFRLAEATARRLRVSGSQVFATAISEFLNRQQGNAVTERLNEVYSRRPAKVAAPNLDIGGQCL